MFGDFEKVTATIGHLVTNVETLRQSNEQLIIAIQELTRRLEQIEKKGNGDV